MLVERWIDVCCVSVRSAMSSSLHVYDENVCDPGSESALSLNGICVNAKYYDGDVSVNVCCDAREISSCVWTVNVYGFCVWSESVYENANACVNVTGESVTLNDVWTYCVCAFEYEIGNVSWIVNGENAICSYGAP